MCCNQTSNILYIHTTSEVILEEKVKDVIFVFQLQTNLFECFCHLWTLKVLQALRTLLSWSFHFTPGWKSMSYKAELSHSVLLLSSWLTSEKLIGNWPLGIEYFLTIYWKLAVHQNHRSGFRKGDWGFLAGKLGSGKTTGRNRGFSVFLRSFLISKVSFVTL